MIPQRFIDKWRPGHAAARTPFNDLYRFSALEDPVSADPRGRVVHLRKRRIEDIRRQRLG